MKRLVALTDQYNNSLDIFDLGTGEISEKSREWSYKLPVRGIAGMQYRNSKIFGDVALMACGKTYACMVNSEGKLLWETTDTGDNPHSIELLPCGVIAVASSSGNCVRFFTPESPECIEQKYLLDAHGVLWDEGIGLLWAVGNDLLTAYKVEYENGVLAVSQADGFCFEIPSEGGHELVAFSKDTLIVTTYYNTFKFDKNTKEFAPFFEDGYPDGDIKGISFFENGDAVVLRPDGLHRPWTSATVELLQRREGGYDVKKITSEIGHYYKCRVWQKDYL